MSYSEELRSNVEILKEIQKQNNDLKISLNNSIKNTALPLSDIVTIKCPGYSNDFLMIAQLFGLSCNNIDELYNKIKSNIEDKYKDRFTNSEQFEKYKKEREKLMLKYLKDDPENYYKYNCYNKYYVHPENDKLFTKEVLDLNLPCSYLAYLEQKYIDSLTEAEKQKVSNYHYAREYNYLPSDLDKSIDKPKLKYENEFIINIRPHIEKIKQYVTDRDNFILDYLKKHTELVADYSTTTGGKHRHRQRKTRKQRRRRPRKSRKSRHYFRR